MSVGINLTRDSRNNMILVTGSSGQIGSELVGALRSRYGVDMVVAGRHLTPLPEEITFSGPSAVVDVTEYNDLSRTINEYGVARIFHMSSVLSALAEQKFDMAYEVNINGVNNILRCALDNGVDQVIIPSSIAAFGSDTPRNNTPNDTVQRPRTIYGISKVFGELLGEYYQGRFGLDVRGVRLPGVISWKTEPTAGTTDYAVAMFYGAIRNDYYECYLKSDTRLPMMYMPDAIKSLVDLSEAKSSSLIHHCDFNVNAMSFTPSELANSIKQINPSFEVSYKVDPTRQAIADSWPSSLDDAVARSEWGWNPDFDMVSLVEDMYSNLETKLA